MGGKTIARFIPSTTALITFEAAARLGGFSRASEELCLSESAVSKQIAKLESFLDLRLFNRSAGRFGLTEAGRSYVIEVRRTLDKLEADTKNVVNFKMTRKELSIAALPTFSNKWLMPRLGTFFKQHSDIIVNIRGRIDPFDFSELEFDAAVHFADPQWQGVRQSTLFSEELIAMASPKHFPVDEWQAANWHGPGFNDAPLLHKVTREDAWRRWLLGARLDHPNPASGAQFDTFSNLIEAVRSGLGIALVPRLYVEQELVHGELVQFHSHTLQDEKTYMLILPDREVLHPSLNVFADWLHDEARAFTSARLSEVEP
ncbi:LysR family glycine cleavage system transcriptional activator [Roseovarius sp. MBR-79]